MKISKRPINASDELNTDGYTHYLKSPDGYLAYSVMENPDFIFVEDLEVVKDSRGQGIGTELLNRIKRLGDQYDLPVKLFAYPEIGTRTQDELIDWYLSRGFEPEDIRRDLLIYNPKKVEANMKITRKPIKAASDYRTFDGLSLDEVEESYPEIYADYFYDIRNDVDEVYISKNADCMYIGTHDKSEDKYYVFRNDIAEAGWYEVDFEELFEYLA